MNLDISHSLNETDELAVANFFASTPSANFMQRYDWQTLARPSKLQHYQHFVLHDQHDEILSAGLIRLSRIMPGRYFANIRRGPVTRRPEDLTTVLPELERKLRKRGVTTLTVNPHWIGAECENAEMHLQDAGYRRVEASAQTWATATAWLDLQKSTQEIYAGMSKRRRAEIRKSEKSVIDIRPVKDASELDRLNVVLARMASETNMELDGQHDFKLHYNYIVKNPDRGFVHVAWVGDEILGGLVTYFESDRAYAYLLATCPTFKNLPRSTMLFWESIKKSQEMGFKTYDLAGFPEAELNRTKSGNAGRGSFKAGFGPQTARLTPMYEKALMPLQHALFQKGRQIYRQQKTRNRQNATPKRSS